MADAAHLIEDYFGRTGQPGDSALDGVFMFERALLRDLLTRLEVALEDEDVPRETRIRVIRCMLYGSPSPAVAELRMRQVDWMQAQMAAMPPLPENWDGVLR